MLRAAFAAVVVAVFAPRCVSLCLSCACEEDSECPPRTACVDRVCLATCEVDNVEPDECKTDCNDENDCDPFFVCDLDNGVCLRDACATDADCELEEAPRCDVDKGFCVSGTSE